MYLVLLLFVRFLLQNHKSFIDILLPTPKHVCRDKQLKWSKLGWCWGRDRKVNCLISFFLFNPASTLTSWASIFRYQLGSKLVMCNRVFERPKDIGFCVAGTKTRSATTISMEAISPKLLLTMVGRVYYVITRLVVKVSGITYFQCLSSSSLVMYLT